MLSCLGSSLSALLPSGLSSHLKLNGPAPKRPLRALVAMVAVCLLGGAVAHARPVSSTWTVNTTADDPDVNGNGVAANCQAGSTAYCSLRDAITAANADSGGTIQFIVTGTITLTSALPAITANVNITGPGASLTTVSGANLYPVFTINSGVNATISGLTIANGVAAYNPSLGDYCGGGIFVDTSATLTLSNSNVSGNFSVYFGAGVCNRSGTLAVTSSTFSGNTAGNCCGGGLFNSGGMTTVSASTFTGNTSEEYGGGLMNESGTLSVTDSVVSGNTTGWYGGGIESYSGTLTVTDSTIVGNTATSGYGGGIEIDGGGMLTMTNSTVAGNTATSGYGGGIQVDGSTATLTNNTITGNTVTYGYGGGIENYSGTLTAANNIVSGNSAYGSADDIDGGYSDSGGNVVGYSGGVPVNTAAAELLTLANYGGTTQTMLPEPGSPAICAGLLSNVPGGVTTDQRGWPMSPAACPSGYVDAGSVQTHYLTVNTLADSLNTGDPSSCTDGQGSTCSLRDSISQANATGYADVAFAPSLFVSASAAAATPGTIALGFGAAGEIPLPPITGILNLLGPGATLLTVSGDGDSIVGTIFTVNNAATALLSGMTVSNGNTSGNGGGINNAGTVTLNSVLVSGNSASTDAGGAFNTGTMNVIDSTFTGNIGANAGILNNGTMSILGSTFFNNNGNQIFSSATLDVFDSTVVATIAGNGILSTGTATVANSISLVTSGAVSLGALGGTLSKPAPNLTGLSTKVSQILGTLAYSPVTAAVPVMLPLPGATSVLCQGSASLLPAGVTTDERGFPMDPQCSSGAIDLGAVQTNYTGVAFTAPPYGVAGQTITPAPMIRVNETNALTGAVGGAAGLPVTWWLTGYSSPYTNSPLTPSHGLGTTKPTKWNGVIDNLLPAPGLSISTAGTYTMSAQDGAGPQQSNGFIIDAATVAQLVFSKPPASAIGAGAAQPSVKVTLESVNGVPITSATGSITLNVTGPNGYTNSYTVAAASGTATFSPKTLIVAGTYSYQAYLAGNTGLTTGAATQSVEPLAPVRLAVSGYPSPWYPGVPANATVSVFDKYGNLTPSSLTVTISTTDSKAVINPAQVSFGQGSAQVSVTFPSLGTRTITATLATAASGIALIPEKNIIIEAVPKFVVNSNGDNGAGASDCTANPTATGAGNCTLRDALAAAQNYEAGTVTFDATVFAAANATAANTITLANGTLMIPPHTSINGLAASSSASQQNLITVDGNHQSMIFWFTPSPRTATASIANLNVVNGGVYSWTGGAFYYNGVQIATGGIFNLGVLTVTGSTFSGNAAWGNGGAILNFGVLGVTGSTFLGNAAGLSLMPGGSGGAISNRGTLTVNASTFSGNSGSWGGAIESSFGTLTVSGSTFSGNSAPNGAGGGIYNLQGTTTVTGSTLAGNSAPDGHGGGIENYGYLSLANSILDGNGGDDLDDLSGSSLPATGQSCSQAPSCDAGGNVVGYYNGNAIATAPINLAPLANYGGSMQTMIPLPGSPAICAAVAANIPAGVTKDERGQPNTNTNYPGYAKNACVDSGAVQTRYWLALTPKSMSATTGKAMTPAPVVTLSEDGKATPYATGTVNMSDASGMLSANSTTSVALNAGSAQFSNLIFNAIGSDSLTALLPLNPSAAPPVALSQTSAPFTVAGQTQTITITVTPAGTQYVGKTATLSATTTSSLAATFSTSSTNCTVNGSTVSYSAGGSCVVNASVPGNSQYLPATASKTITVALNPQTIAITVAPAGTQYAGKTATLSGSATSGQTVTFGTSSTNCTVKGNTVNYSAAGSCVITATVPANSTYAAATANKTIAVALAPQTITLTLPTAQQHVGGSATQAGTAGASTFVATASSDLPVTLTALTSNCAVTGNPGSLKISFSATGSCAIAASQAGNQTVWAAAPAVANSTTVAK